MHALNAVDLLLQRNGDGRFHDLRVGAHVIAGDRDLRRSEIRVQGDRKRRNAYGARQDNQQMRKRSQKWGA